MRISLYIVSIILTLVLFTLDSQADDHPLIINVDGRQTTSLDGEWNVIIDPYETGFYNYRGEPSGNGFFRDVTPRNKQELIEYSFDNSDTLTVPGDWNTQRAELFYYEGTIWYRRKFEYRLAAKRRLFVHFGAANYEAGVYLNGKQLGVHVGGFTPFQFEITRHVNAGENSLVVKVDNKRRRDGVPTTNTDWWNYGGLTRRVLLIETPETFVRDYAIQLDSSDATLATGWIKLDGPQRNHAKVSIAIEDNEVFEGNTNEQGLASFRVPIGKIDRWSPENPKLQATEISGHEDSTTDQIGFRTIEVKGRDILLNGKPIFLRGICLHEERPKDGGRAYSAEHAETQLHWAKELNCNFVRLAHYPHNEAMIRTAEKMGLLVWSEIPVYWTIHFDDDAVYVNAERQLTEMITRDRNRACIAMWSVANETPPNESRLRFLKRLINTAHRLDATRPVTAALETHYKDETTIEINDPLGEFLDILGCNEYLGWYDGLPEKAGRIKWTTPYNKPLIISEFGAGAKHGQHGAVDERWTEEYQADVYRQQINMLRKIDFLRGTSPWILKDFRSPRRLLPDIQDNWNRKGLVSEDGKRKAAFDILKKWYQQIEDSWGRN